MKSPQRRVPFAAGLTIKRARDEACRQDFVSFIRMSYDLLPPGKPLLMNWHIEAMAYHLEQVRLGIIKRLMINSPAALSKIDHYLCGVPGVCARSRPDETLDRSLVWL